MTSAGGLSRRRFLGASVVASALAFVSERATGAEQGDELIEALDLDRAGLEQVKRAANQQDWPGARREFAAYLRNRRSPHWYIEPGEKLTALSDADRKRADAAMEHRMFSVGIEYKFDGPIDWKFNPTTQPGSKDAADHEWTWQLNRHGEWVALARAFSATGDEKYGRELAEQLRRWIAENPMPQEKADQGPGSRWRTIECGIRMGGPWMEIFWRMLKAKDVFPDDVLLAMVSCMKDHAEYLDKHPTGGNWLTMEANGEFHVGVLFPEFKRAEHWRTNAISRLRHEIDTQVYPDGAQKELTPGYHNVALINFVWAMKIARLNDVALPDGYREGLEKMYEMNVKIMTPDGDCPPMNDSWHVDVAAVSREGLAFFPNNPSLQWAASGRKAGKEPSDKSLMMTYAGWAVMRSSWERDAMYMLVDTGPFGMGHQHEDKLSIILHAYGSRLIFDAGSYAYDASPMRAYVLSARGHNVIHVDGIEQYRRLSRITNVTKDPVPTKWISTAEYDYAQASYGEQPGEVWGPMRSTGIVHTRRVLFVKGEYWIIVDSLTPADDQEHVYESTFHLDAPEAEVDETSKAVKTKNPSGANLAILPLAGEGLSVRIIAGQETPFVQGWLPRQHGLTGAIPRPTVYYTRKGKGAIHFCYAFVPWAQALRPVLTKAISEANRSGISAHFVREDGDVDRFALTDAGELSLISETKRIEIKASG